MARAVRARDVAEDCLRRRHAGEHLPDDAVLDGHPELLPELGDELRKLRVIERAVEVPLPEDPPTVNEPKRPDRRSEAPGPPPDIPDYQLFHRVGCGAFGEVWLGGNRHTGQF